MSSSSLKFVLAASAAAALFGAGCGTASTPIVPPPSAAPVTNAPSSTSPTSGSETGGAVKQSATVLPSPATTAPAAKPAPTTTKKTTTATTKTSAVTIINSAFSPQVLAITTGDTVVWTNKDGIPHTTVSDGTLLWDSGNLTPGSSFRRTFAAPGTYSYHCGVHPSMVGTIIVRDAVK